MSFTNNFIEDKVKNANLEPLTNWDEIEIYNICHLMVAVDPTYSMPYEEFNKKVLNRWLELNDAVYYAAPRENFSYYDAAETARKAGKTKVMVEDLS